MNRDFQVKVVTPVFPGGADPAATGADFEGVRPTSVTYGLRWWFRAFAGGLWGSTALQAIRDAESAVFGSQDKASRVRVSVDCDLKGETFQEKELLLKYLAYGMFPTSEKRDVRPRCYLAPGPSATFSFTARVIPHREKQIVIPQEMISALAELWVSYSGVGARWRHGLGGISLASDGAKDAAGTRRDLASRYVTARDLVNRFLTDNWPKQPVVVETTLPTYPVATSRWLRAAWRSDPRWHDWRAVLKDVAKIWRGSRLRDRENERSSSLNNEIYARFLEGRATPGEKVAFGGLGLPIPFGFPKNREHGAMIPFRLAPPKCDRAPSPVVFRVIPVKGGFGVLALLWTSQLLPPGTGVMLHNDEDMKDHRHDVAVAFKPAEATGWFETEIVKRQRFELI